MVDIQRQAYPIGDTDHGQIIQVNKPLPVMDVNVKWIDRESLTVSSTAIKLVKNDAGFDYAFISVETDNVRFTLDDTLPTSVIGHIVHVGGRIILEDKNEIKNIRFIRITSDVTLQVSYGSRLQ